MGKALYRRYRGKSFDEIAGQNHVTKTLKNAIASGRISHAYLFSGPKGVGKTSVARILAYELNKIPYEDEKFQLDIIEIDGASNRRIEEVRELREKVHIPPTSGKYKVYIIDEVHMLTREAFNALLKTLEEPPDHCIFILATTEAHKLPETIVSRTQHYAFKPIGEDVAVKHLGEVAKRENITITKEALKLLAKHGEGSFRDSLGLLDQLSGAGEITEEMIRQMLGVPAEEQVNKIVQDVQRGNLAEIIDSLQQMKTSELGPAVAAAISEKLRDMILLGGRDRWITDLLRQLQNVSVSQFPFNELEIDLLEVASSQSKIRQANNEDTVAGNPKPDVGQKMVTVPSKPEPEENPILRQEQDLPEFSTDHWPNLLEDVKKSNPNVYSALRLGLPEISGDKLILSFEFPLHQKKVSQAAAKKSISDSIKSIGFSPPTIECTVDKSKFSTTLNKEEQVEAKKLLVSTEEADTDTKKEQITNISNIFGAAELLES